MWQHVTYEVLRLECREEPLAESNARVSFEDVVFHLAAGDVLDTFVHPNQARYPGQQIHAVMIEDYVMLVPFIETDEEVFLKTIIPSRKATKTYRGPSDE